ncbi:MAG: YlxR family protein [Chloroflexi bacterium]|nr:MAG: YlxR family protein [Chloroflexota bacterium]
MARKIRRKHVARRTCVVCRQTSEKRALHRIVRTPDGVRLDPTGKLPGRGAYLCDDPACWKEAANGRHLDRALKTSLSEEERQAIRAEYERRLADQTTPLPQA